MTGVAAGSATISYTVSNSCGASVVKVEVTVSAAPSAGAITGSSSVNVGSTDLLKDAVSGGVWSSKHTSVATISSSGTVKGVSAGTDTITYTVTNGCGSAAASFVVTVRSIETIKEIAEVCAGATVNINNTFGEGTWISSDRTVATVSNTGLITGISAGTAVIEYSGASTNGTDGEAIVVLVHPAPAIGNVGSNSPVNLGAQVYLYGAASGGSGTLNYGWSGPGGYRSSGKDATVSNVTEGIYNLMVMDANGCTVNRSTTVKLATDDNIRSTTPVDGTTKLGIATENWLNVKAVPNPAQEAVTVNFDAGVSGETKIRVMDVSGTIVFSKDLGNVQSGSVAIPLENMASGIYMIELTSDDRKAIERIIKE